LHWHQVMPSCRVTGKAKSGLHPWRNDNGPQRMIQNLLVDDEEYNPLKKSQQVLMKPLYVMLGKN